MKEEWGICYSSMHSTRKVKKKSVNGFTGLANVCVCLCGVQLISFVRNFSSFSFVSQWFSQLSIPYTPYALCIGWTVNWMTMTMKMRHITHCYDYSCFFMSRALYQSQFFSLFHALILTTSLRVAHRCKLSWSTHFVRWKGFFADFFC